MRATTAEIWLKKGKEHSAERYHPWIFSGAINKMEGTPKDGDWVRVNRYDNKPLGMGHYQRGSITVRLLSFGDEQPGEEFYKHKILAALELRLSVGLGTETTNAFRLVHAEGDGLPGLIIDFYDGVAVVQAHSLGIHFDREDIGAALREALQERLRAIYYKSQSTLAKEVTDDHKQGYLFGMSAVPHIITENRAKFLVDWEAGQKTGFFLDQRDNRSLLASYASDRHVLNTFCYTGGFSVYALNGGASLVHSVDASTRAIDLTARNIELNGFDPVKHYSFASDTFDFMKDKEGQYDLIVLDPPAFAKHKDSRHQAIKGYQRLNAEAMRIIRRGGLLFTFSCSQVVDKRLFYDTVVSSAIQVGRKVKVLHQMGQPADHPVSLFHPEGEYLKGLVLYVD